MTSPTDTAKLRTPPLDELRQASDQFLSEHRTALAAKAAQIEAELGARRDRGNADPEWAQRAGYALARTREGLAAVGGVLAERGLAKLTTGGRSVAAARHRLIETGFERDVLAAPDEYSTVLIDLATSQLAALPTLTGDQLLHAIARVGALMILELDRRAI